MRPIRGQLDSLLNALAPFISLAKMVAKCALRVPEYSYTKGSTTSSSKPLLPLHRRSSKAMGLTQMLRTGQLCQRRSSR